VFTLLSWNVLADAYVRREHYPDAPEALLAPGARRAAVTEQLASSGADVIGLQELDAETMRAAQARLAAWEGIYLPKGRGKPDGCGLFVRREAAAIAATRPLEYSDGSGHVALLAELVVDGRRVGVATTHVRWDPPKTPHAERFATRQLSELRDAAPAGIPWLLCGDFNVVPDDPALAILHQAGFVDVFAGSAHDVATANANKRGRRIDFIFARDARAEPRPVPRIDDSTTMPSERFPSDHLAISARVDL